MSGDSPSNILRSTDHLVAFILHTLEEAAHFNTIQAKQNPTDDIKVLNHPYVDPAEDRDEIDSDDETAGALADGDIAETAINLLLSILEGPWLGLVQVITH